MAKTSPTCIIEDHLQDFQGIFPKAWISADQSFAREEIKNLFFAQQMGIVSNTLVNPETLAALFLGVDRQRVLGPLARQEVLRMLLGKRQILSFLPELKKMKRGFGFYKKLDQAIQAGRRVAGSDQEAETMDATLGRLLGKDLVREEIGRIAVAYEAWMQSENYWDDARLLQEFVISYRKSLPLAPVQALPEKIFRLESLPDGGLVQSFWDSFKGLVPQCEVISLSLCTGISVPPYHWNQYHTLDDAADALADRLFDQMKQLGSEVLNRHTVLIPDDPSVRRTLNRAFKEVGIPSRDSRDPTEVRLSEALKKILIPLEMVAKGFDRKTVLTYLRSGPTQLEPHERAEAIRWIEESGFRFGLTALNQPLLGQLYSELEALDSKMGKRPDLERLKMNLEVPIDQRKWFESFLDQFERDLTLTHRKNLKAPVRFWYERIVDRLSQSRPKVDVERPENGVQISKLGQAPFGNVGSVHLFGLPPRWIEGDPVGDLWLSDRAREILAQEFQVQSTLRISNARNQLLNAWREAAEELVLWDASFQWDGSERESLLPGLVELSWEDRLSDREPIQHGAHPKWIQSYAFIRPQSPSEVRLEPISNLGRSELSATELDVQSRCGFLGLAQGRWKLYDGRTAEPDLWGDVRGNLYHSAAKWLIENRSSWIDSNDYRLVEADHFVQLAIDQAWDQKKIKGFLKSERLIRSEKRRMTKALSTFCEKEADYLKSSQTKVLALEGPKLELFYNGISVTGYPDRLDVHSDGVFVIDYKTSSNQPKGAEILENEYALQLPFYALAAKKHFSLRPLGFQFLTFDQKGSRTTGLFFKDWNFSKARKGKSLLTDDPNEVFDRLNQAIEKAVLAFSKGEHDVAPKLPQRDCETCRIQDLCGIRRRLEESENGDT